MAWRGTRQSRQPGVHVGSLRRARGLGTDVQGRIGDFLASARPAQDRPAAPPRRVRERRPPPDGRGRSRGHPAIAPPARGRWAPAPISGTRLRSAGNAVRLGRGRPASEPRWPGARARATGAQPGPTRRFPSVRWRRRRERPMPGVRGPDRSRGERQPGGRSRCENRSVSFGKGPSDQRRLLGLVNPHRAHRGARARYAPRVGQRPVRTCERP